MNLRKKYILCIIIFIINIVIANNINGEPLIKEKNIPITMSIYREDIPSSLYIKCKVEDFNKVKINNFEDEKDINKKDFKNLILSIQNNDSIKYRAFGKNYKDKVYNDDIIKKADTNLKAFHKVFEYYDQYGDGLNIYKHIFIGNGGLFIFGTDVNDSSNKPFKTQRRALKYEKNSRGEVKWNSAEERNPLLTSIICNTFQEMARKPKEYTKKQNPPLSAAFDYSILIPGTEGKNPAYLQFNGHKYRINIMNESAPADDKVLSFYQEAYLTWKNISTEEFKKYYTESSQERIKSEEERKPGYLEEARQSLSLGRTVLFIMDANPFFVVFFRIGDVNKTVYNEYIVIDPDDGKMKLNLASGDYTNDYFLSPDFQKILNKIDPNIFKIIQ